MSSIEYTWRGVFANEEVNALHAEAFTHQYLDDDWNAQVARFSLGWVTARSGGALVGFVNVVWDGGAHAFLIDIMVARSHSREGIGKTLVEVAVTEARQTPCEWLHVDFEEHLRAFYLDACGFAPTDAGLIGLR